MAGFVGVLAAAAGPGSGAGTSDHAGAWTATGIGAWIWTGTGAYGRTGAGLEVTLQAEPSTHLSIQWLLFLLPSVQSELCSPHSAGVQYIGRSSLKWSPWLVGQWIFLIGLFALGYRLLINIQKVCWFLISVHSGLSGSGPPPSKQKWSGWDWI